MNLKEYLEFTNTTAIYPDAGKKTFTEGIYLTLGLASEAGEVAGKLKKVIRGDTSNPEAFIHELGDVLWYLVRLCDHFDITLEDLAEINANKLAERKAKSTIKGDGDNR